MRIGFKKNFSICPYYIEMIPDFVQEEVKQKVVAALTAHSEYISENVDHTISYKSYDIEEMINMCEYVERIEESAGIKKRWKC